MLHTTVCRAPNHLDVMAHQPPTATRGMNGPRPQLPRCLIMSAKFGFQHQCSAGHAQFMDRQGIMLGRLSQAWV